MEAINLKQLRKNLFGLPTTKVNRSLFGEVDHEEVKKDLQREYQETLQQKSKLWNFDFDKYCPKEVIKNTTGLEWIPYTSSKTEYSIKENTSLVSSSLNDYHTKTHETRPQAIVKSSPITRNKSILNSTNNEEENIIEIVNESPIRNIKCSPNSFNCSPTEESKAKLDITKSLSRKRKRGSHQPTIDGKFCILFYLCFIFLLNIAYIERIKTQGS